MTSYPAARLALHAAAAADWIYTATCTVNIWPSETPAGTVSCTVWPFTSDCTVLPGPQPAYIAAEKETASGSQFSLLVCPEPVLTNRSQNWIRQGQL